MLTVEQAKPGTEVICINVTTLPGPGINLANLLKIGHVYTINKLFLSSDNIPGIGDTYKGIPAIYLNELDCPIHPERNNSRAAFAIFRFKLLEKKDIKIFYDILEQPLDQKILEQA